MEMKACPYCKEDVKSAAIVCRYCMRSLVRIPERKVRKIYVSNIIGSVLFFSGSLALVLGIIAEYTGIGGSFAPLAEPFTPIRNEYAKGFAAIGAVVGFYIGVIMGLHTARQKLNKLQGKEVSYL